MVSEKDTYLAAQLIIRQHGPQAREHALTKMRRFIDDEDAAGAAAWLLIANAVSRLEEHAPSTQLQ